MRSVLSRTLKKSALPLQKRSLVTVEEGSFYGKKYISKRVDFLKGKLDFIKLEKKKDRLWRMESPKLYRVEDINPNNCGAHLRICTRDEDAKILHGAEYPSLKRNMMPDDALNRRPIPLSTKAENYIYIDPETPFDIQANPEDTIAHVMGSYEVMTFNEIPSFESRHEYYHLVPKFTCNKKEASDMWIKVDKSPLKEKFEEEETVVILEPDEFNPFSMTRMNFKGHMPIYKDVRSKKLPKCKEASPAHTHPSSRMVDVYIPPLNTKGSILNLCGVALYLNCTEHNPYEDESLMSIIVFPPGITSGVTFRENIGHQFFGKFTAISTHPYDGKNVQNARKMSKSDSKSKGFLELATKFYDPTHEAKKPNIQRMLQEAYANGLLFKLDNNGNLILDEEDNVIPVCSLFRVHKGHLVPKRLFESKEKGMTSKDVEKISFRDLVRHGRANPEYKFSL